MQDLCYQRFVLFERCSDLFRSNTCSGAPAARSSPDSPPLAARDLTQVATYKNSKHKKSISYRCREITVDVEVILVLATSVKWCDVLRTFATDWHSSEEVAVAAAGWRSTFRCHSKNERKEKLAVIELGQETDEEKHLTVWYGLLLQKKNTD